MHDPERDIRDILLSQLELSPDNVRKTPADDSAFTELKASIAAHGLLENLIARSMEPGPDGAGRYAVIGGGRRLAAMQAPAAEGALDENHPVPCRMIGSIVAAEEVSLAENSVRAAMRSGSARTVIGLEPILGLDPGRGEGARAVGPLSALWYIVFVVPYFLWTPDAPRRPRVSNAVAAGLRDLKRTLALLPSRGSFLAYLVSSMFYRDALGGMYVFGGIYAAGVLGWGMFEIGLFGALGLLGRVAGAWIGGRVDSRFGPKPVIVATIVAVMVFSCIVISTGPDEVLLIGFSPWSAAGCPWTGPRPCPVSWCRTTRHEAT